MPGTLLAYDEAFPRAAHSSLTVVNHPSLGELQANSYPAPHQLLPLRREHPASEYISTIHHNMRAMHRVNCLILFGHGHVARLLDATGIIPITTGIVLGSQDLGADNVRLLRRLRDGFAPRGKCELWVCNAANPNRAQSNSGSSLCQSIADALNVEVVAPAETQSYRSEGQEFEGDTVRSTVVFLPFEGNVFHFRPNAHH